MSSEHVEAIVDFKTGKFFTKSKKVYGYCITIISCFSVAYGLYKCFQFFTKNCLRETQLWSTVKHMAFVTTSFRAIRYMGMHSILGIPLAQLEFFGQYLLTVRCIASSIFECRCEDCSS